MDSQAAIAIQSNQNDQHGGQSIPAFDYYLAPGVLKTFKKQYKIAIAELLDFTGFDTFINSNKVNEKIDKLASIKFDLSYMDDCAKDSDEVKNIFAKAYEIAMKKTDKRTANRNIIWECKCYDVLV